MPAEAVQSVEDLTAPGPESRIPVRVYRPATKGKVLSVLVYMHGGGYYYGGLDWNDPLCRTLANRTPCVVVGVGYRLAPETQVPCCRRGPRPPTVARASGKSIGHLRSSSGCVSPSHALNVPPSRHAYSGLKVDRVRRTALR